MSMTVDYPNEDLYAKGQPRLVQRDAQGNVTMSRVATVEEARDFGLIAAMDGLVFQMQALQQQISGVEANGIRVNTRKPNTIY